MKKINRGLGALAGFFMMITLHAAPTTYADIAIFLDTTEKPHEGAPVITPDFAFALCQKKYPVLTTSTVFLNFMSARHEKAVTEQERLIAQIAFDVKEWNICKTKNGALYLFLPPNGDKNGFNLDALDRVGVPEHEKEMGEFLQTMQRTLSINVEDIQNVFRKGKGDEFVLWNIYMVGHGKYAQTLEKSLILERHFTGAHEQDVSGAELTGLTVTQFRSLLQFFTTRMNVNFLYYMTCYGGDNNLILPYITAIVGQTALGKEAVKYTQKPDFTIAAGSLTSQTVLGSTDSLKICAGHAREDQSATIDIAQFFSLLRVPHKGTMRVLYKKEELQKILTAVTYRNTTDAFDTYGISALPSIMFPGTEKFFAFPVDDTIMVLSSVTLAPYQGKLEGVLLKREPMPHSIEMVDKQAVLLYVGEVPVTINIQLKKNKNVPGIVSMVPGISFHYFKSIQADVPFSAFMRDSFATVTTEFAKNYVIEELTVKYDEFTPVGADDKKITLQYVFVSQKRSKDSPIEKHEVPILFVHNGDIFSNVIENNRLQYASSKKIMKFVRYPGQSDRVSALLNYYTLQPETVQQILDSLAAQTIFTEAERAFMQHEIVAWQNSNRKVIIEYQDLDKKVSVLLDTVLHEAVDMIEKTNTTDAVAMKSLGVEIAKRYAQYQVLEEQLNKMYGSANALAQRSIDFSYHVQEPRHITFIRHIDEKTREVRYLEIPRPFNFADFVSVIRRLTFVDMTPYMPHAASMN